MKMHRWKHAACSLLLAATVCAATSSKAPTPRWLEPIPPASRSSLIDAVKHLVGAESRQDWATVYRLRPFLDRETESQPQFIQRMALISPGEVVDFEPSRSVFSEFGGLTPTDQVFDVMGCAQVRAGDRLARQRGSITAHLDGGEWFLEGVHLLADDDGRPEPCVIQPRHGVAAARHQR